VDWAKENALSFWQAPPVRRPAAAA